MARANTCTHLTIDRFAQILGINPLHLNGAAGSDIMPTMGTCGSVYPQYTWQVPDNLVSREEIAQAIYSAEQDIKRILGFSVAPEWECGEVHHLQKGRNGLAVPIKTRYGRIITGGRRVTEFFSDGDVTYSDLDGDGYAETATVRVLIAKEDPPQVLPQAHELTLYFAGHGGDCAWQIRYPKSVKITDLIIVPEYQIDFVLDSWLLFRPEQWEAYPTNMGFQPIDMADPLNYVTTVDVVHEYTDPTFGAEVYPVGCEWDVHSTCLAVHNRELGFASPVGVVDGYDYYACMPQYDALDTRVWYYAGEEACDYGNRTFDPMTEYWAQTVAWIAAARLEKPLCSCTNVQTVAETLQRDTAMPSTAGGSALVDFSLLGNPFGTRVGELRAWQRVMNMDNAQIMSAGVF